MAAGVQQSVDMNQEGERFRTAVLRLNGHIDNTLPPGCQGVRTAASICQGE